MPNRKLALAISLVAFLVLHGCGEQPTPRTHRIEIKGMVYAPAELTAAPGDTVVWVNHDIVPHTVTADGRQFDSGSLNLSAEWSLVVRERGRFPYTCTFHPPMKAVLDVK
jgi:plastocyanin